MFGGSIIRSEFDILLAKATKPSALELDWQATLQICDLIKRRQVKGPYVAEELFKRLKDKNHHCVIFTLQILDACLKNCGSNLRDAVINEQFLSELHNLASSTSNPDVKSEILRKLQSWAKGFEDHPRYSLVNEIVHLMKSEGFTFPEMTSSDAMFDGASAPDWAEGDNCTRCRTDFTLTTRKHHCRNCGDVFCAKCSSNTASIPKYGLDDVRVCDDCHKKLVLDKTHRPKSGGNKKKEDIPPELQEYFNSPLAKEAQAPPTKSREDELKEQEELQLALAISQSEAEAEQRKGGRGSLPEVKSATGNGSAKSVLKTSETIMNESPKTESGELDKYLNRSYWEERKTTGSFSQPSAPIASPSIVDATETSKPEFSKHPVATESYHQSPDNFEETEKFLTTLEENINVFTTRIRSNVQRGRPIVYDSAIQSLFQTLTTQHRKLTQHMNEHDEARANLESLQDKVTNLREANEALEVLRAEHAEKLRQEEVLRARERQQQMAQKLGYLRERKRDVLEIERRMALQRIADDERELHRKTQERRYGGPPAIPPGAQPMMYGQPPYGVMPPVSGMGPVPPMSMGYANNPAMMMPPAYNPPNQGNPVHNEISNGAKDSDFSSPQQTAVPYMQNAQYIPASGAYQVPNQYYPPPNTNGFQPAYNPQMAQNNINSPSAPAGYQNPVQNSQPYQPQADAQQPQQVPEVQVKPKEPEKVKDEEPLISFD